MVLIWLISLTMYIGTKNTNFLSMDQQQSNKWIHTFLEKNILLEKQLNNIQNEFNEKENKYLEKIQTLERQLNGFQNKLNELNHSTVIKSSHIIESSDTDILNKTVQLKLDQFKGNYRYN